MSRFYLDTEFLDADRKIDLISIALVTETGQEFYAISTEFNRNLAKRHEFVAAHVLPQLPDEHPLPPGSGGSPRIYQDSCRWMKRSDIRDGVLKFLADNYDGHKGEFWGDWCAYDWVAFCQLFGEMIELPEGMPYYCNDTEQYRLMLEQIIGRPITLPNFHVDMGLSEHHALHDARTCLARWRYLNRLQDAVYGPQIASDDRDDVENLRHF